MRRATDMNGISASTKDCVNSRVLGSFGSDAKIKNDGLSPAVRIPVDAGSSPV